MRSGLEARRTARAAANQAHAHPAEEATDSAAMSTTPLLLPPNEAAQTDRLTHSDPEYAPAARTRTSTAASRGAGLVVIPAWALPDTAQPGIDPPTAMQRRLPPAMARLPVHQPQSRTAQWHATRRPTRVSKRRSARKRTASAAASGSSESDRSGNANDDTEESHPLQVTDALGMS